MQNHIQDIYNILPLILVGAGVFLSVVIEITSEKSDKVLPWFSVLVLLAASAYSLFSLNNTGTVYNNMLAYGGNVGIFNFLFTLAAALTVLSSMEYIKKYGSYFGEYYILILSSVLGMMMMAGAKDLFMVFIGLEQMSICFYVLAGINRKKSSANEASLKYFLLGSFATGFIVYGIALIFGTSHTTNIDTIITNFGMLTHNILFVAGMLLFLIGFSFKIAAFPFHMWVPDVYQGSATTVSGLMSTGGKAAAFSVLIIALGAVFPGSAANVFRPYFAAIATFSMLYGSIVAISQSNLKRMLAYSSIAHAGYMAIGLAAGNNESVAGIMFYLIAYTFMNLGAFGIIAMIEGENDSRLELDDYIGLSQRHPVLAALMALFMFSLSGLPPFAGFFGKYYVFISAIKADMTWLAILGVLSSVISVYFYIRVIVYMYFRDPEPAALPVHNNSKGVLAVIISALLVIGFGLFPGTLIDLITSYLR
ncbi:MAG: NADH-quinone oxidoreductase subunit N [Ignavibacteria bacterium]|jgi:NADH-quinone oxidoreductase subunit N|nr:NADH-quinone oxidoreductase subunit N [Ignavibacteria bacterium]MCU7499775.1 NADH-quinone oxidoreductase subunit N [Ignavibacteria bacterium]MCU7513158.1 NADH-quinone oxidoreductase subunit N [Ignavibacteria bacterium]MCU7522046.1 NADH-quinone oxidoreductase subunit N [Ignavibacteria bacterium]MCU7524913.1 NADH-quinone oxidoreductase subunit N [Ignavibacteria bacterium]